MKLNKRIFLLLSGIAILLNACHHNAKPQEHYDTVSITTYHNTYDSIGRLVNVQAMEKLTIYYDKDKGYTQISNRLQWYLHSNDSNYIATELSGSDVITINCHGNIKEELHLQDGKDTTFYSFTRYYAKDKPEYAKHLFIGETSTEREASESYFIYDHNGDIVQTTDSDLITGEKTERYFFKGITYKEARQKLPPSECKQEIVCETTTANKDTVIVLTSINGSPHETRKEYKDGELRIEVRTRNIEDLYQTDSIYYRNNRKLKEIHINSSPRSKNITVSVYDEKGHLLKSTSKDQYKYHITNQRKSKPFLRVNQVLLNGRLLQSAIIDCTVHCSRLYGLR